MNKKLAAALSGGAVLVLTLSGCGDDSDDKVNDWAKKFCAQAQPQLQKIDKANAAIGQKTQDNDPPAEVQKTDSVAFQQMSDAYKALGTAVGEVGPPPVDDGEATQKAAMKELNASSKEYAELKTKVEAVDIKDQHKFSDGLKTIANELERISTGGNQAMKKLESGKVGAAMSKQKGCQKQPASTGPSGSGATGGDAPAEGSASGDDATRKDSSEKDASEKNSSDKDSSEKKD
ncbi:small secreted protein [Streptomyces sp. NPDC059698]|uniref:small secreted protein n=1 Tax=unclassified Streptomyces TaxID=2593676 RepID=UPI00093D9628|nr:small secreted protein [Streptomyces sp. CB02366]OKJ41298.1 small secreted protein [Streptomyces sp. CB02366]